MESGDCEILAFLLAGIEKYINFVPKKMNTAQYPSKLLENAVAAFAKLPGIGQKTALRLVLHLLRQPKAEVENFADTILTLRNEIKYCKKCHNISDIELCAICSNPQRQTDIVCVVENVQDVMAIENTQQYKGLYHVLGGLISPMDGIGPADLKIESLIKRIQTEDIKEVVFALNATMEGDTTNFYIYKKLAPFRIKITIIARGIAVGDELEYADEITLGRSILNRIDFSRENK
ncbi:recombination protein RecR [Bacteroidia bacterium]|nr:recombination protein RecR [Bacteroidia bacterium]